MLVIYQMFQRLRIVELLQGVQVSAHCETYSRVFQFQGVPVVLIVLIIRIVLVVLFILIIVLLLLLLHWLPQRTVALASLYIISYKD